MERLTRTERRGGDPVAAEREHLCLHCGERVPDRPRGCKGGTCQNCGHPYPLGDCSD